MLKIFSAVLNLFVLFAGPHAHQHGHAKMSLAFEGNSGVMTFDMPSETVYGFEYLPKTQEEKKTVEEKNVLIKKDLASAVAFEAPLGCVTTHDKTEREQEGSHSDLNISFKIKCEKSPKGTSLTFNVQKVLPKLKEIDVQILIDDLQKSIEIQNGTRVELK
jgi:hypothetical protein